MADENESVMIPYFAHEGEMNRLERVIKKLWIALLIVFLALVGTNIGWIVYESQFTDAVIEESYEADASENSNAVINGEGQVNIGGGYGQIHTDNENPGESE